MFGVPMCKEGFLFFSFLLRQKVACFNILNSCDRDVLGDVVCEWERGELGSLRTPCRVRGSGLLWAGSLQLPTSWGRGWGSGSAESSHVIYEWASRDRGTEDREALPQTWGPLLSFLNDILLHSKKPPQARKEGHEEDEPEVVMFLQGQSVVGYTWPCKYD